MSMLRRVTVTLLAVAAFAFYILMICLIYFKSKDINIHEHMFRSLHALEYPATSAQLSLVSFRTPGLPTRLASTWEIQNERNVTPNALSSVYDMLYPTIQDTLGMQQLLRAHTPAPCPACGAQRVFSVKNALTERQTRHYCPLRGENITDWAVRTRQPITTGMQGDFDRYTKFNFHTEHSQLCRANRSPFMALAHVATHAFSLFSLQSNVILSMYLSTVHVLFTSSIGIYLWYGHRLLNTAHQSDKIALHGKFSVLFFLTMLLSIVPVFADYLHRDDTAGGYAYGTKAVGSYVLGLWTVMYAFVYIKLIPPLLPAKKDPPPAPAAGQTAGPGKQDESAAIDLSQTPRSATYEQDSGELDDLESAQEERALSVTFRLGGPAFPKHDRYANGFKRLHDAALPDPHEVVRHFDVQQRVVCFAYWNLAQAPCVVMIALTEHRYGVDMYVQFAIFGAIAVGLLDVLQTRVMVILGVIRKIGYVRKSFDYLVWVLFLFVKCVIAVPVLLKLQEAHVPISSIAAISVVLWTQTLQNLLLLVVSRRRKFDNIEKHVDTYIHLFYTSLYWHVAASVGVFLSLCST
jgi:hypothetical protein